MTEEILKRYHAAAHAIQSGIAQWMNYSNFAEPKHLRVGIDLSKAEQGGLATLLIKKGVFTAEEYSEAMAEALEREKRDWEIRLSEKLGIKVELV